MTSCAVLVGALPTARPHPFVPVHTWPYTAPVMDGCPAPFVATGTCTTKPARVLSPPAAATSGTEGAVKAPVVVFRLP